MSSIDHLYCSSAAKDYGLPAADWQVAVGKFKSPFGRRVVVGVRNLRTNKTLTDTVVGANLSKRDLDRQAIELVKKMSIQLGFVASKPARKRR